jgi:hypothetical protein
LKQCLFVLSSKQFSKLVHNQLLKSLPYFLSVFLFVFHIIIFVYLNPSRPQN